MDIEVEKKIDTLASNTNHGNFEPISGLKNVLIADLGEWAGHRSNYLKTVIRLFEKEGRTLHIISSNEEAVSHFLKAEKITNATVLSIKLRTSEKIIFKAIFYFDRLIHFLKLDTWFKPQSTLQLLHVKLLQHRHHLKDALVFFTSVSDLMPLIPVGIRSFLFPKTWAGIYVTPWYNTGNIFSKEERKKRAYGNQSMALPSCKAIFVIHSDYTRYYRRLLEKNHFFAIPEPISLEINQQFSIAKEIKKSAAGRFTITLLGGIGKKRNLLLLLNALNLLNNKNWFLVIIGKLQKSNFSESELNIIDTFLKKNDSQCFIKLDGYITIEQNFNAVINATDLMYLHYHRHPFSSNQLLKAIALRKPVIVNQGGIIESIIKETKWSAIVPDDSETIATQIEKIQNQFIIDEDAYAKFMQALDYKNLRSTILNQLETTNPPA